ncbi:hypothetical protein C2G38_2121804 [Gigaspora rosea]|uniref:Uncharacterized protein n=1 Tax=Gigaspora rosea TaxID=44941 RepID=A0A397U5E2_9GLOM|nr:hypothetical protein C2G38_2121804 [Gigaspora rosea]
MIYFFFMIYISLDKINIKVCEILHSIIFWKYLYTFIGLVHLLFHNTCQWHLRT